MFSSSVTLLALAAGLVCSTVTAEGWYEIKNKCNDNIYFQRVGQRGEFSTGWIEPHTTLSGSYGKDGDGISVKLNWNDKDFSHPYQFETTVRKASWQIFYDLSAVDGDPLINVNRGIRMSDHSGPAAWCPAWHEGCAYNYPTDDSKTHAGSLNGVVIMDIC